MFNNMLEAVQLRTGYRGRVTNALDSLDNRPRGKKLAALLSRFVPADWGNYFS